MQAVQPIANVAPNTGAPTSPTDGLTSSRNSRDSPGNQPANIRPNTMTTTPSTRVITSPCTTSTVPSPPNNAPYDANTTVNPAMNKKAPSNTRARRPLTISPADNTLT